MSDSEETAGKQHFSLRGLLASSQNRKESKGKKGRKRRKLEALVSPQTVTHLGGGESLTSFPGSPPVCFFRKVARKTTISSWITTTLASRHCMSHTYMPWTRLTLITSEQTLFPSLHLVLTFKLLWLLPSKAYQRHEKYSG